LSKTLDFTLHSTSILAVYCHLPPSLINDTVDGELNLISAVDPGVGEGGDCPPNKKYTWARVSFRTLKVLAELQKIAPRMHHKSPF